MREVPLRAATCSGMALALAGCGTWLNEEHCLFEGGDRGCAAGRVCVVVIGGGEVPEAIDGCLDEERAEELDPERHLHLRYGLPMSLEAENNVLQSDSVQGILAREIDARGLTDVCSDVEGMTSFEDWPELEMVFAARRRLEGLRSQRKVGDDEASVSEVEATAVQDLYASVETWALACERQLAGSSSSGTGETTDALDETSSGSTTEGPECTAHDDCSLPSAPFCNPTMGMCVSCDETADPDGACAEESPETPVCLGDTCVQCTAEQPEACQGTTPVCDDETNTCIPCTTHTQCTAACDIFTGACFDDASIVHVGPLEQFPTIGIAVDYLYPSGGVVVIHEDNYLDSLAIDANRRVALLAAPGDLPTWDATGGPQISVSEGAAVMIDGLSLVGNLSYEAMHIENGSAWLDRVRIAQGPQGITAEDGAELVVQNSFIAVEDPSGNAITVYNSSLIVAHSTLIMTDPFSNTYALYCPIVADVTIRNSIVLGGIFEDIDCPGAVINYSATTNPIGGEGNAVVGPPTSSWFIDVYTGDLHLEANGALVFQEIARWQVGDPTIDIDGDPRPGIDGSPDFAGADVPNL